MWKIGPEVRRAACEVGERDRGELRRAQHLRHGVVVSVDSSRCLPATGVSLGRRAAHEQRGGDDDGQGDAADRQHRGAPVIVGDDPP